MSEQREQEVRRKRTTRKRKPAQKKTLIAIIRLRGRVNTNPKVKHTLELLRLHKKFHMVVYPKDLPGLEGMLRTAKDWITWGEIDEETLKTVLEKRGRTSGNKRLTKEFIKENFKARTLNEFVKKVFQGKIVLHKQDKIKPVFRLHPPKGGFDKTPRRPYQDMGELGYRGPEIKKLILRMI
jgi:large subunit ribosomal protein L30